MKYNISAIEVLKKLGYEKQTQKTKEYLEKFEAKYNITLPILLKEFRILITENPLMKTADIWTDLNENLFVFYYDELQELIENEVDMGEFNELSKESWNTILPDYLEIGSDVGAGVVVFAIKVSDLDKKNPNIYYHFEDEDAKVFNIIYKCLSDYFLSVVCDVLSEGAYYTASKILKTENNKGKTFSYTTKKDLTEQEIIEIGIELSKLYKVPSIYCSDMKKEYISCCIEEETGKIFVIKKGLKFYNLYSIY